MFSKLARLLMPLSIIAVVPFATMTTGAPHDARAGGTGPQEIVENFFDEVDAGDVDGAVALLADGFIFTQIDEEEGSFAAVGKPAFAGIIEEVASNNNQTTLSNLAENGTTVTGVAAFTDDDSAAAGVDRYLQPFTITVIDGLATRADFTYDRDDEQTAAYLEYNASQGDDGGDEGPPPGSVTVTLSAQPGGNQPGEAVIFEDQGVTFVSVFVEPGPAGVQQPAHFHTGTCAAPGPIVQPLANVLNGGSFTLLSVGQAELVDQGLIINVHKSVAEPAVYVGCGEVLSAAAAPTPTIAAPPPAPTATATPATGVTAPDTGTGPGNSIAGVWVPVATLLALAGIAMVSAVAASSRGRVR